MGFLDIPAVKPAELDTTVRDKINDANSATRGALNATFGPDAAGMKSAFVGNSAPGMDAGRSIRDVAYRPFWAQLATGGSQAYILGHSVVAGNGATNSTKGFATLVKNAIIAADPAAVVNISGNPSKTSGELLAMFASAGQNATYTSLTIFMGLLNDYFYQVAPATTQANLEALVAKMKAIQPTGKPAPAFLILVEWLRSDLGSNPGVPWSSYVNAAKAVAAADPTVAILDVGARMGNVSGDLNGFYADAAHPNDKGHAMVASLVQTEIIPKSNGAVTLYPAHTVLPALLPSVSNVNWASVVGITTDFVFVRESSGAQNDSITYEFLGAAGKYDIALAHRRGSNRGMYNLYIDGALQGTGNNWDGYASSPTNTSSQINNFQVLTSGKHTLEFRMVNKNASSTGYVGSINSVVLTRTGNL